MASGDSASSCSIAAAGQRDLAEGAAGHRLRHLRAQLPWYGKRMGRKRRGGRMSGGEDKHWAVGNKGMSIRGPISDASFERRGLKQSEISRFTGRVFRYLN